MTNSEQNDIQSRLFAPFQKIRFGVSDNLPKVVEAGWLQTDPVFDPIHALAEEQDLDTLVFAASQLDFFGIYRYVTADKRGVCGKGNPCQIVVTPKLDATPKEIVAASQTICSRLDAPVYIQYGDEAPGYNQWLLCTASPPLSLVAQVKRLRDDAIRMAVRQNLERKASSYRFEND